MEKTVLIIDDDRATQELYRKDFRYCPEVTIIPAYTLTDGYRLFSDTLIIDLIVVDGCVDDHNKLDSLHLIKYIRSLHTGDIIAASSSESNRLEMLKAGCNHQCDKKSVLLTAKELLGI